MTTLDDVLIDITVQAAADTQTCGLRVLQYHAIIGKTFAQSPGILKDGGEALQQFIVEVVLPQLHQVNWATTTEYYEGVRVKLQQPDWGVPLRTHPTWPEVQTLTRKRKSLKSNRQENQPTRGAQAARREMRQMQLWETRPQDHMAADSSPAGGHSTGNLEPLQTSENQLQQVHRWLAESTQE